MQPTVLQVHPHDDMLVTLKDHAEGDVIQRDGEQLVLVTDVPAKHKFALRDFPRGALLHMYGITVGEATCDIAAGELLTTTNLRHAVGEVTQRQQAASWNPPDVTRWKDRTFMGYVRDDGRVGTGNYWVILPLVFCENRNLDVMRDALLEELGYVSSRSYRSQTRRLAEMHREGTTCERILETSFEPAAEHRDLEPIFPNVDGIKFLRHEGGCGGTYEDAIDLCGLLAGYVNHPNVAGATVLSLGCQKSQIQTLQDQLHLRNPQFNKPLYIFEQQQMPSEQALLSEAIKHTFAGLMGANQACREPASLDHLVIGLECGGSDGFSGISANPAIGHCSDLLVALGGTLILSEFPELAGCEQDLTDRCAEPALAERFLQIMKSYSDRVIAVGSGFESNPSPGNIKDGLITDAIKSAGAAKKGGTSPIVDVLDYPEPFSRAGLNLLCTPGSDVESTTAMAGSGANVQIFSTGLGTPTGNAISPVIKVSSNRELARRMSDVIDLDAGGVITGEESIQEVGERLLEMAIRTASGEYTTKAQALGQDDFIPWKRGLSF